MKKSLKFDGTGSYIQLQDGLDGTTRIGNYKDFTFAAWLKFEAGTEDRPIFSAQHNATTGWNIYINSSEQIKISVQNQTTNGVGVNTGEWYHIVATHRDAGNATKLYINGTYVIEHNTHVVAASNTSTPATIGQWSHVLGEADTFLGNISDIKIWDRFLNDAQVAELYDPHNEPSSPGFPEPTHHWEFGDNKLDMWEDIANNSYWANYGNQFLVDNQNFDILETRTSIDGPVTPLSAAGGSYNENDGSITFNHVDAGAGWNGIDIGSGKVTNGLYKVSCDVISLENENSNIRISGGGSGPYWHINEPGKLGHFTQYMYATGDLNAIRFYCVELGTSPSVYNEAVIKNLVVEQLPCTWANAINIDQTDIEEDAPFVAATKKTDTHSYAASDSWLTKYISFDGSDDYFEAENENFLTGLTSAFSVSAWVRANPDIITSDGTNKINPDTGATINGAVIASLYDYSSGATDGWYLGDASGNTDQMSFGVSNSGSTASCSASTDADGSFKPFQKYLLNGWTHVCGTFEPSTAAKIYFNGYMVGQDTSSVPAGADYSLTKANNFKFQIGGRSDSSSYDWPGDIAEIAIYSKTLSDAEVLALTDPSLDKTDFSKAPSHLKCLYRMGGGKYDFKNPDGSAQKTTMYMYDELAQNGAINDSTLYGRIHGNQWDNNNPNIVADNITNGSIEWDKVNGIATFNDANHLSRLKHPMNIGDLDYGKTYRVHFTIYDYVKGGFRWLIYPENASNNYGSFVPVSGNGNYSYDLIIDGGGGSFDDMILLQANDTSSNSTYKVKDIKIEDLGFRMKSYNMSSTDVHDFVPEPKVALPTVDKKWIEFDGTDEHLDAMGETTPDKFTWMAKIKMNGDVSATQSLYEHMSYFTNADSGGYRVMLHSADDFYVETMGHPDNDNYQHVGTHEGSVHMNTNAWNTIAITHCGFGNGDGKVHTYINGQIAYSEDIIDGRLNVSSGGQSKRIGKGSGTDNFSGKIAFMATWNDALTHSDIERLSREDVQINTDRGTKSKLTNCWLMGDHPADNLTNGTNSSTGVPTNTGMEPGAFIYNAVLPEDPNAAWGPNLLPKTLKELKTGVYPDVDVTPFVFDVNNKKIERDWDAEEDALKLTIKEYDAQAYSTRMKLSHTDGVANTIGVSDFMAGGWYKWSCKMKFKSNLKSHKPDTSSAYFNVRGWPNHSPRAGRHRFTMTEDWQEMSFVCRVGTDTTQTPYTVWELGYGGPGVGGDNKVEVPFNVWIKDISIQKAIKGGGHATPMNMMGNTFGPKPVKTMGLEIINKHSFDFDGTDEYIEIDEQVDNLHTSNYTYTFWAKRDVTDTIHNVIGGSATGHRHIRFTTDGKLNIETNSDGDVAAGTLVSNDTLWHHYAVVISGGNGTCAMYQDGTSLSISGPDLAAALTWNRIGQQGNTHHFNGHIAELAIYTTDLSAVQIVEDMSLTKSKKSMSMASDLRNWWTFGDHPDDASWTPASGGQGGTSPYPTGILIDVAGDQGIRTGDLLNGTGNFEDASDWVLNSDSETAYVTVGGGEARIVSDSAYVDVRKENVFEVGKPYKVVVTCSKVVEGACRVLPRSGGTNQDHWGVISAPGTYTMTYVAQKTGIGIGRNSSPCDMTFSDIKIYKINDSTTSGDINNMSTTNKTTDTP